MPARINPAYMMHTGGTGGKRMVAVVNPAYFMPGTLHSHHAEAAGNVGTTKHGKAGAHGRRHGSPMPTFRDPWKHKAQGRNKR